jgi:uncharacterized protein
MQTTLAVTALLMGLAGGPHCVAMCGAACGAISQRQGRTNTKSILAFQFGRMLGYASMGSFAAMSVQGLGWLSVQSSVLRPVWTMFHIAAAMLGLVLVWQARQPLWFEVSARNIWTHVRLVAGHRRYGTPLVMGTLWSLMPCGLLYSALLVAALSPSVLEGAGVMALFAVGSSVSLVAGPWLWSKLRRPSTGNWAIRLAGLVLFMTSAWSLWMGLAHNTAPWCATG